MRFAVALKAPYAIAGVAVADAVAGKSEDIVGAADDYYQICHEDE